VRAAITRRGGQDPDSAYALLGMERWYLVCLDHRDIDIEALCRRLRRDSTRIESASPNQRFSLVR
jgi:hypothetical protein